MSYIQLCEPNPSDHKPVIANYVVDKIASEKRKKSTWKSPYPIDESAWVKSTIGWTFDCVIGTTWRLIAIIGLGSDKAGFFVVATALLSVLLSKLMNFSLADAVDNMEYLYKRID